MKLHSAFIVTVILSALLSSSAWSEFEATPVDKYHYSIQWSGCTLPETLEGMYIKVNQPCIAAVLNDDTFRVAPAELSFPETALQSVASALHRDHKYIAGMSVICPYQLPGLYPGRNYLASSLVTSLSAEQLSTMAAKEGIPFTSLTAQQQELARFLSETESYAGQKFPEPEFTKRLGKSRLMMTLSPSVRWSFQTGRGTSGGSSFVGYEKASADLWRRWEAGQIAGAEMKRNVESSPGSDGPGDSSPCGLQGVYTLKTLMDNIALGSPIPVTCDSEASEMRIAAYCSVSRACVARALAVATGLDWKKEGKQWLLTSGSRKKMLTAYGPSTEDGFYKACKELSPAVRKVLRGGNAVYLADAPWKDAAVVPDLVDAGPVKWSAFTKDQQAQMIATYQAYLDSSKKNDAPQHPSELKLEWRPVARLFMCTDDTVLCSMFLDI